MCKYCEHIEDNTQLSSREFRNFVKTLDKYCKLMYI